MAQADPAVRPDPRCFAEARVWLATAAGELHTAQRLLAAGDAPAGRLLHAASRAAENSLRAFLCANGLRAALDSGLRVLGEKSLALDPSLHPAVAHAEELAGADEAVRTDREAQEGAVRIAALVYESVRLRV